MQTGFSFLDIVFLIVMAIFIVSRFTGNKMPKDGKKTTKNVVKFPEKTVESVKAAPARKVSKVDMKNLSGLEQIKVVDSSFNKKDFLEGSEFAYKMYYDALNERDEETLEGMLAPRKFDEIMESVESLEEEGKQRYVAIQKIKSVEVLDARLHGRTAIIDVKYTVMQKDSIEKLNADKPSTKTKEKEVSTVWAWAKSVDSEDLNWELESISLLS
ncbi:MAG: putative lipid-binding transport protein (Tim44 family) [Alphaproteobacteria bacterium]|jgi:predicted lipid-binding transport protein (Tim44 family)